MSAKHTTKYIFLAGGLSAGPITPLLAVAREWQHHHHNLKPVILDSRKSVAYSLAKKNQYIFHVIVSGKLRRYWSVRTVLSPFLIVFGFLQSLWLLNKYRPVAVLGAGGFVQVPVLAASWILRIPRFIHQQDVKLTLSNAICAPLANLVTVTFESSLREFPQGTGLGKKFVTTNKVHWTGNPSYQVESKEKISKASALREFGLHQKLPVLLVVGGGTGSKALNDFVVQNLAQLTKVVQILHSTGSRMHKPVEHENYHSHEFIHNMAAAYEASDIVLSRAGLGSLTDLAHHKKPAIIVPMPDTHQEDNAALLYHMHAAIVIDQQDLSPDKLLATVRELLFKPELVKEFTSNLRKIFPENAAKKIYTLQEQYLTEHE